MSEGRRYYLVTPLAYTGAATAFTYHYDEAEIALGSVVQIQIGPRKSLGVVTETIPTPPEFKTKALSGVLDVPPVPEYLRQLAAWMSDYYASSPSAVWSTLLPAGLTKTRREVKAKPAAEAQGLPAAPLTEEQTATLAAIRASDRTVHLVQGVTGAGKTRLYLELAAEALTAGRSVVVLVPEITLTPQIVGQFEAVFGADVLTTHSKLTEAQRDLIWRQAAAAAAAAAGQPRVVVGPRSSLFLPLANLGLIVVDECHETSYKQEQHPRYHALAVAAKLGQLVGARVIFGSATPGLGELFLAQAGRIEHYVLSQRANQIAHSQAEIIDMRNKDMRSLSKFITQPIIDAVTASLAEGRQSLLYLNRRGSATSQVCDDCGHVSSCPNCLMPLTFHADLLRLICHHCNFRQVSPAVCPECHGASLKLLGGGTKRIEAEVERLWPEARLARLDRDSATLSHIKAVYKGLRDGSIDIVIGTQMIAKGLDLPAIDTVGVINADTLLHVPDFSAAERTYQLLTQVSGRTGRGDRPGRVFIQTHTPEHPAIQAAARGDYAGFASAELAQRQLLRYPPFVYLLKLTVAAKTQAAAMAAAGNLARQLQATAGLLVMGPAPAFIETQAGTYRWVITVRATRRPALVAIARNLPDDRWTADLDPLNLL
jgi:primosomal protein N' (replication factor Y)